MKEQKSLAEGFQTKDPDAVREILSVVISITSSYAKKFGIAEDEAHDVAQEVMLRLLRAPRAVSKEYVRVVARNIFLDRLRLHQKERRTQAEDLNTSEALHVSTKEKTPSQITEAILKLPEKQQVVLTKRYLESMTIKGISEELGLSSSSVRVLLSRALENLRHIIAKELSLTQDDL